MWDRVNKYLKEFGFHTCVENSPQVAKDDYLPENMVYRLGFKASNEVAQRFQAKLADEILPAIRKHGAYMTEAKIEEVLTDPDTIIKLAQTLKDERAKRKAAEARVEAMRPKEIFADAITTSEDTISIGDMAKLLKQNGIPIGRDRLFEWLMGENLLMKAKYADKRMPTQRAMEMGLFMIKETPIHHNSSEVHISKTVKVTPKGQTYLINRFLNARIVV